MFCFVFWSRKRKGERKKKKKEKNDCYVRRKNLHIFYNFYYTLVSINNLLSSDGYYHPYHYAEIAICDGIRTRSNSSCNMLFTKDYTLNVSW